MPTRTVKGPSFSIWINGQQIVVKHLYCKGKRCRVVIPSGAVIQTGCDPTPPNTTDSIEHATRNSPDRDCQAAIHDSSPSIKTVAEQRARDVA